MKRLAPRRALAVMILALAVANVVRSTAVPGRWHTMFNVGIGVWALFVSWGAGLRLTDIGLGRASMRDGLRLGAMAFGAISAVVVVLGLTGVLVDDRASVSARDMLIRAVVIIPLGTVLPEELAFRGTLDALARRCMPPHAAVVVGAILFGLWHVLPTWRAGGASSGTITTGPWVGVIGTFAATAVAGVAFLWLRSRSHSLLAPILAHLATNSVVFAVAWLASP